MWPDDEVAEKYADNFESIIYCTFPRVFRKVGVVAMRVSECAVEWKEVTNENISIGEAAATLKEITKDSRYYLPHLLEIAHSTRKYKMNKEANGMTINKIGINA